VLIEPLVKGWTVTPVCIALSVPARRNRDPSANFVNLQLAAPSQLVCQAICQRGIQHDRAGLEDSLAVRALSRMESPEGGGTWLWDILERFKNAIPPGVIGLFRAGGSARRTSATTWTSSTPRRRAPVNAWSAQR